MDYTAYVYCDCYEKGKINSSPPLKDNILVNEEGQVIYDFAWSLYHAKYAKLEQWIENGPCAHKEMLACDERLGTDKEIEAFKTFIENIDADKFQLLTAQLPNKTGGILASNLSEALLSEIDALKKCMDNSKSENENLPKYKQILEAIQRLVHASIATKHPIVWD